MKHHLPQRTIKRGNAEELKSFRERSDRKCLHVPGYSSSSAVFHNKSSNCLCFRELERGRKQKEEKEEEERTRKLKEELMKTKKAGKKDAKDLTKKKPAVEVCF